MESQIIDLMKKKISVIGLGKLGASMVGGFASRGFNVIGVDINKYSVESLNKGIAPVQETDLDKYISENKQRISATLSHKEAILGSNISFVIVPTPSDTRGAFSLQYASFAFEALGKALKDKHDYHVIVLTSTVLPGATRTVLLPILEKASGKKCGKDFGLCYSPEFIALGSVIRDFLNPDFYLVGEFDERSGDMLEEVNKAIALNNAPCKRMSIENAEIAKIAVNSFVTLKISYANMLLEICEQVPGGNVDVVTDAIGMDKRIGKKYLKGGLGFGGPCFPRDNVALSFIGRELGVDCQIIESNDRYNRENGKRIAEKIKQTLPIGNTVSVLGLAYKPKSHVIEESQGLYIARALADAGYRVLGYDPLAKEGARQALKDHVIVTDSLEECLNQTHAIIIATEDEQFTKLLPKDVLKHTQSCLTIFDCWRCLPNSFKQDDRIEYIPLGCYNEDNLVFEKFSNIWESEICSV